MMHCGRIIRFIVVVGPAIADGKEAYTLIWCLAIVMGNRYGALLPHG